MWLFISSYFLLKTDSCKSLDIGCFADLVFAVDCCGQSEHIDGVQWQSDVKAKAGSCPRNHQRFNLPVFLFRDWMVP